MVRDGYPPQNFSFYPLRRHQCTVTLRIVPLVGADTRHARRNFYRRSFSVQLHLVKRGSGILPSLYHTWRGTPLLVFVFNYIALPISLVNVVTRIKRIQRGWINLVITGFVTPSYLPTDL